MAVKATQREIAQIGRELKGIVGDASPARLTGDLIEDWKESASAAPAVTPDVSRAEFARRYQHARYTLHAVILITFYALIRGIFADTLISVLIALLSATVGALIYLRLSYRLWRARKVYANWRNRAEPFRSYFKDFIADISDDLSELAPLALPKKRSNT